MLMHIESRSCSPARQVLDPSASTNCSSHAQAACYGCSLPHLLTNSSNKSCLTLTGTVLGIVRWSYTLTKASPPATANCHGRLGLQWMELSSSSDPCRAIDEGESWPCREAARAPPALYPAGRRRLLWSTNCCLSEHPNLQVPPQQVQPCHKALQASKAHRPVAAYMEAAALHISFVPSCHRTPQADRSAPNRSMHEGSSSAHCLPAATGCYKQAAHPPTAACMGAAAMLAVLLPQGATRKPLTHQQQHAWTQLQCCSLGGRSWSTASCRRAPPGTPALAGQSGGPRRPPHSCSSENSETSPQLQQSKQQNLCTRMMNTVGLRSGNARNAAGRGYCITHCNPFSSTYRLQQIWDRLSSSCATAPKLHAVLCRQAALPDIALSGCRGLSQTAMLRLPATCL